MLSVETYIRENNRRRKIFDPSTYDPLWGIGSHIPRFEVYLKTNDERTEGTYFLPDTMLNNQIVQGILNEDNVSLTQNAYKSLTKIRLQEDYEFYAAFAQKIKHKETGVSSPFVMNYPQRAILHPVLDKQRRENKPIRGIVVKARQWGGSTYINGKGFWIQEQLTVGWNSCIVGDVEDQGRNIRAMYSNIAKEFPSKELGRTITLKNFENSTKNKVFKERDSVISIGSMQRPDSLRSGDIKIGHLSEVGLWKETLGKKPEDVVQSIRGSIPDLPLTMLVLESTAKGIGNFFHREYLSSLTPDSEYEPIFVPWFKIERYQSTNIKKEDFYAFILSWDEYEKSLWDLGATIEGIHWYRRQLRSEYKGDRWRMGSEFPSTVDEAFSSTGRKVFPPQYINSASRYNRDPEFMGQMVAKGNCEAEALQDLRFEPFDSGELWVWDKPSETPYKNRYLIIMDVGGRHHKADPTVITVIDRYWESEGGNLEVVARWRGRYDYDLSAWIAVQIASWYQNGLLVIESNFYDARAEYSEGDNFLTVLDEIKDHYDNLYTRTSPEKVREGAPVQYGYHTNVQTRPKAIGKMLKRLRQGTLTEPDFRAIGEMRTLVYRDNGRIDHEEGSHDDILMTDAIGCDVSDKMDVCEEIKKPDPNARKKYRDTNTQNLADF